MPEDTVVTSRRSHCTNGHVLTDENTYVIRRPDGRSYRRCRICSLTRIRRYQSRISGERWGRKLLEVSAALRVADA